MSDPRGLATQEPITPAQPILTTPAAPPPTGPPPSPGRATTEGVKDVASAGAEHAKEMVTDARQQVRNVVERAVSEARSQADTQATRAADGLRRLSAELQALSEGRREDAGQLGEMATSLTGTMQSWASRLEGGSSTALDEARRFARRRPGAFLLAAAGAGFVAGRLVRAGTASGNGSSPAPAYSPGHVTTAAGAGRAGPELFGGADAVPSTPYIGATGDAGVENIP